MNGKEQYAKQIEYHLIGNEFGGKLYGDSIPLPISYSQ